MDYLNMIGILVNLFGALFLAFSTKVEDPLKNIGAGIKIGGQSLTIATIRKGRFITGILLLVIGFALQLTAVLLAQYLSN